MSSQKGLVQRIERRLEATVGDAFARVFGGTVVPYEVEALLRREAGDGIHRLQGNRILAPNEYIITLGTRDFEKVGAVPDLKSSGFARDLTDYIYKQGWQTYGEVVVRFEQSSNLHTGQFRARGAVNPDAEPRPTVNDPARPQSNHAFSAEQGVPPMTDNSSYQGGQGQGRPGDDYYDDRYVRPQDEPGPHDERPEPQDPQVAEPGGYPPEHRGYPPQSGQDPRGGYPQQGGYQGPPEGYPPQSGYSDRGFQDPRGGYPDPRGGYPPQAGYQDPRGSYPDPRAGYQDPRGGYPPYAGYQDPRGGYPPQPGYPAQGGPDQGRGGYPEQHGQGGYPTQYEQRPAAPGSYPGQGYDQGHQQGGGYGPPGGQQGYGGYVDYGRAPARPEESGYAPQGATELQRPAYPEQGAAYDQGYQPAGEAYGHQDYTQAADHIQGGGYAPPQGGYGGAGGRDYEYGQAGAADYAQPAGGGYGGYAQGGYGTSGTAITLQLDDGSGRTYQLREGSNIVGRGQDAQFRLPDTGVSRRHLEIRWDGQVALLSDLNSTNGTTVNNAPVQEWQLADGDVIRLGHSEIIVRIH